MIIDKVKEVLAEQLNMKVEDMKDDSRLVEDLSADSIDIVALMTDLELMYDMEISDLELPKVNTIAEVAAYIEKHI